MRKGESLAIHRIPAMRKGESLAVHRVPNILCIYIVLIVHVNYRMQSTGNNILKFDWLITSQV